ncbi:MAG: hypothetical protein OXE81_03395 [Gammaproteobacteria bacterium]|nr:hypothetical protein [Gammaproteobacteria bacterium]
MIRLGRNSIEDVGSAFANDTARDAQVADSGMYVIKVGASLWDIRASAQF